MVDDYKLALSGTLRSYTLRTKCQSKRICRATVSTHCALCVTRLVHTKCCDTLVISALVALLTAYIATPAVV
jgi:hypothetical protein